MLIKSRSLNFLTLTEKHLLLEFLKLVKIPGKFLISILEGEIK